ncbi:MAG: hypothetical protein JXR40_07730 [Pontiellaceae bacterium]|nr:hypothetical protein [Pontiellaceae bacterium]
MNKRVISVVGVCAVFGAVAITVAQMPGGGNWGRRTPQVVGDPAPVPKSVAIARPTAQEVEAMNAELKKFIESNTSASKDLLKKYADLISVVPPRDNPCVRPTSGGVRDSRHDAFVEIANNEEFDILFHGDSITDWWQQGGDQGGAAVFEKYFGDMKVANFAVAGDTTQGLLWGLQNGEGQGHKPKVVMLMIGTNSAGSSTGAEIAEGVGAVILELQKDFPDAKILLLAIFPRGSSNDDRMRQTNEEANKIIAKLADDKKVFFMNINDKFLNDQGGLIGFRGDNLHPNAEGYEIWAQAVKPTLEKLLK